MAMTWMKMVIISKGGGVNGDMVSGIHLEGMCIHHEQQAKFRHPPV